MGSKEKMKIKHTSILTTKAAAATTTAERLGQITISQNSSRKLFKVWTKNN